MNPQALLIVLAMAHLLPCHLVDLVGGSIGAVESVCYAFEATALYLWVSTKVRPGEVGTAALVAWGASESLQRGACRLMLPMDRKPVLEPGQNVCDAATGWPISQIGLASIAIIVMVLVGRKRV